MKKIILALLIMQLSAVLLFADIVYLNDGQVFSGKIISQNNDTVTIETNSGRENINRSYVYRIEFSQPDYRRVETPFYGFAEERRLKTTDFIIKLGIDFDGKHNIYSSNYSQSGLADSSFNGTTNTTSAATLTTEYLGYIDRNLGLGIGVTSQFPRKQTKYDGYFSFSPLYGLLRLRTTPDNKNCYKYLTAHFGGTGFAGDEQYKGSGTSLGGGLYWAAGGGLVFNLFQVELLYTVNYGSISQSGYVLNNATGNSDFFSASGDIEYSTVNLNFGLNF